MRTWSWLLVFVAACGGTGEDTDGVDTADTDTPTAVDPCAAGDLALELGTGENSFVPLSAGQSVTMIHGPQGGWHVDVGGIVSNTRQTVSIKPRIVVDSTQTQIAGDQEVEFIALAFYDAEACSGTFWGRRAFVDDRSPTDQAFICSLEGETATLSVELTDPQDGRTLTQELSVTLALDPIDAAQSCP